VPVVPSSLVQSQHSTGAAEMRPMEPPPCWTAGSRAEAEPAEAPRAVTLRRAAAMVLVMVLRMHLGARPTRDLAGVRGLRPDLVVEVGRVLDVVGGEPGEPGLAGHRLQQLAVEADGAEAGAAGLGGGRRHAGGDREPEEHGQHRIAAVLLPGGPAADLLH